MDISTKEGKQRLIDGFINAIYLYDDKITFTFNYKDGTKTVFLSELNCTPSGSDIKCLAAPAKIGQFRKILTYFCAIGDTLGTKTDFFALFYCIRPAYLHFIWGHKIGDIVPDQGIIIFLNCGNEKNRLIYHKAMIIIRSTPTRREMPLPRLAPLCLYGCWRKVR